MPKPLNLAKAVEADINRATAEADQPSEGGRPDQVPGPAAKPSVPGPPPRPPDPPETPAAPRREAKSKQRPAKPTTPVQPAGRAKELQVTVPRSLVDLADADERSRSDVVRAAFNRHADTVRQAAASVEVPAGPMNLARPTRRRSSPEDPFVPMMLRLAAGELGFLDDAAATAALTRSAFVSELLEHELR